MVTTFKSSNHLHPTYYARKRDAQAEYLSIIKRALRNTIQNVNFVDPTQNRRAHEALMHDVDKRAR